MIILRTHQQRCLDKIKSRIAKGNGSLTGRIVIPTGGGKTFVEAFSIGHQMKKKSRKRKKCVCYVCNEQSDSR